MVHNVIIRIINLIVLINSINIYTFQLQDTAKGHQSLLNSFQYDVKDPSYRLKILPNNFNHLSNLISIGNNSNQPPAYLRSLLKLFSNLLKGSPYVNAIVFEQFLDSFSTLAQPYFGLSLSRNYIKNNALYDVHMFDRVKEATNNILYFKFSSDYDSFKQNPAQFLEFISSDISAIVQEEITRDQLSQAVVRFAEIVLSKLIWDVSQPEKSWANVKHIAEQLAGLLENNILDDSNDLDDLYWTLVTRYCYFIDVTATDLSPAFYSFIKRDLLTPGIILFELDEQDTMIESKLSYMQRAILLAEVQSRSAHIIQE